MINPRHMVCGVVLQVLYRGVRVLAKKDSRIRQELLELPQGCTIRFCAGPGEAAPKLAFTVGGGTIEKASPGTAPDIDIVFKNDKMAFRVFTGRMSVAGAYAAHAFVLSGNINDTMAVVRIVDLVEGYLFPKIITKRLLKTVPKKQYPTLLLYLRLIPGV